MLGSQLIAQARSVASLASIPTVIFFAGIVITAAYGPLSGTTVMGIRALLPPAVTTNHVVPKLLVTTLDALPVLGETSWLTVATCGFRMDHVTASVPSKRRAESSGMADTSRVRPLGSLI